LLTAPSFSELFPNKQILTLQNAAGCTQCGTTSNLWRDPQFSSELNIWVLKLILLLLLLLFLLLLLLLFLFPFSFLLLLLLLLLLPLQ
jgi:hypothetical protein